MSAVVLWPRTVTADGHIEEPEALQTLPPVVGSERGYAGNDLIVETKSVTRAERLFDLATHVELERVDGPRGEREFFALEGFDVWADGSRGEIRLHPLEVTP